MNKILTYLFFFMTVVLYANNDTLYVTAKGFKKITINRTSINDIITEYGNDYKLKVNKYTWAIANTGSGCIHLEKTKKFYTYKKKGITFITTENDTITGIIFSKKANIKTNQNIAFKKLRKNKIEAIINNDSTLLKDKRFYINRKNQYGFSQKYSKKTNRYCSINGIEYCYRKLIKSSSVNKKILEIKIGN